MKITAVVVTFNRLELLKQGIECLRKQQKLTGIIVVNNGSTDGTREWLDAQPGLLVVHQDNVGGSGGFYTGIERAYSEGADWIWCMDDDVFPRPDCLDRLLPYTDRPEVGILSPRRLLEGKVFTHEFRHFNFTNPVGSLHSRKLAKQQVNQATEIVGADFEGPFISRRVVEKIGLPNRELFIFCDDTDYCLRAHLAGFKLLYIPEALMDKHKFFSNDTWTSRNRKKKWKRYYQVRNEAYLNHHYGRNFGVRYLRSFIGVAGYIIPALLSMPFTEAWQWKDLSMLWTAYQDGIHERLGKR
ncbi:glycosyltransferase family 2 protein [Segatella buccae]|uniref:Glycosyltransferase, group 2 family protein n=1 Tax=Segatella buccae ATCC 33574 TaxID=873513 RepID=E6K4Z8_9BACT|nr:glycosyltransferase family 2 protein [Segatella buccae]EFU31341.1 glycosyltransferase, group 2 family protein [Segatella buccae ATCC 33574]